jgi:hypothetical protein
MYSAGPVEVRATHHDHPLVLVQRIILLPLTFLLLNIGVLVAK